MPSTSPVPQQPNNRSLTLLAVGATTVPWVPLLANCALIFGGVMFLREYRRGKSPRSE